MFNITFKLILIFIILSPITVTSFLDYNIDQQCLILNNQNNQYVTPAEYHNYILHQIDIYVFLIVCPICLLSIIVITSVFIIEPSTRQMPGDIILMLGFSDMCLLGQWISTSIYYLINPPSNYSSNQMPSSYQTFCRVESFFGIVGGTGQFVYNSLFCIFMITQIKVGIKGITNKYFRGILYHGLGILIISTVTILSFAFNKQGLSVYGTCSLNSLQTSPQIGLVLVFLYFCLALGTVYYFNKQIPNQPIFKKYRDSFLIYYNKYITCTLIIWGVLAVSNLIITLNCKLQNKINGLAIFVTIGNVTKLATPVVLTIIRYQNPSVKEVIKNILRTIFCIKKKQQENNYQIEKSEMSEQSIELDWFNKITSSLRFCQIYTIMTGINQFLERRNKQILTESLFDQKLTIYLSKNNFITDFSANIMEMKMTVYAPSIFQQFLKFDKLTLRDLSYSLNIESNKHILKQQCSGDGGASGQFFLFSHDNRFILKTMSEQQFKVFLKNLQSFHDHFSNHKECLITKFYGIFKFSSVKSSHPTIYILITRNICIIPKKFIKVIYDLKGSSYNRQVLKKSVVNITKKVLKDIDFQKEEKYVQISRDACLKYKNILIQDSIFFKILDLIDYSLIIAKVEQDPLNPIQLKLGNEPSITEPDIWYRIGIIDYLQIWNNKKKIEMITKKILNRNLQLDTSAQNPEKYSNRFIQNLINRIFLFDE